MIDKEMTPEQLLDLYRKIRDNHVKLIQAFESYSLCKAIQENILSGDLTFRRFSDSTWKPTHCEVIRVYCGYRDPDKTITAFMVEMKIISKTKQEKSSISIPIELLKKYSKSKFDLWVKELSRKKEIQKMENMIDCYPELAGQLL